MCEAVNELFADWTQREKERADAAEKRADDAEAKLDDANARILELEAENARLRMQPG